MCKYMSSMKCGYNFFPLPYFSKDLLKTPGQNSTREGYLIYFILILTLQNLDFLKKVLSKLYYN